ncbi:MAG: 1-acyl-sn-glycerol-3-phosphate acyltransferase [Bacteroidetes bacterium]|nr:1-acyl-sn-glycerol-3-phosphate acyltransferase [Bacteroidota bacterium]
MRPLYFLLRVTLPYLMRIFYGSIKTRHTQKQFKTRTIFISNHPSAFIDPLVVANFQWPIFHFMVRSDVFKAWLKPVTWACHMVPIYRLAEDGKENLEKNAQSFRAAIEILKKKNSLIMFGEGYTDDVFIRSLKPIKKGPARIGFSAMVQTNWELDILIQPTGINYGHPKYFRTDMLLSVGELIHLKDYKALYDENPAKAHTKLTRDIELSMQEQITYVRDKNLAPFVENIQVITRKGMNHFHHDHSLSLEKRFDYSRSLAKYINANYNAEDTKWTGLKTALENYFTAEKKEKINDDWIYQFAGKKSKNLTARFLYLILVLPIFLVGVVHNLIPYVLVKSFVEKIFKRDVFWSGVKMLLGGLITTLYNLPVIWLFHHYVFPSYWLGFLYFMTVPAISLIIGHAYFEKLKDTFRILRVSDKTLSAFAEQREKLAAQIKQAGI